MPGAPPRRMKILARAAWHKSGTGFSGQNVEVIAPCHLIFEATSVIRNHVYRREISAEAGQIAFDAFLAQGIKLLHPGFLEKRAWELAGQYNRPTAYDACYLALAESAGCELWTADDRLYKAVHDTLLWVKSLRENAGQSCQNDSSF
jgi:predicted nucleic acid-binding protein